MEEARAAEKARAGKARAGKARAGKALAEEARAEEARADSGADSGADPGADSGLPWLREFPSESLWRDQRGCPPHLRRPLLSAVEAVEAWQEMRPPRRQEVRSLLSVTSRLGEGSDGAERVGCEKVLLLRRALREEKMQERLLGACIRSRRSLLVSRVARGCM